MRKWHKYALISSSILLLASAFISYNLEDILIDRLNDLVKQDKNRLYDYNYDQLEISLSKGDVVLTELKIKPRLNILDSLSQLNEGKELIFDIELSEFKLKGLGIFEFLLSGEIDLNEINFKSPTVNIYRNSKYKSEKQADTSKLKVEKEFFSDIVSSGLKEANIDLLTFQNASLKIHRVDNKDTIIDVKADSSSFKITGIKANEKSLNSSELFYYDSSAIDLRNVKVYLVKDYRIELGRAYKSSRFEDFYFSNMVLSPLKDKYAFMKDKAHQTEWFKFLIKNIILKGFDFTEYQKSRSLNLNKLLIDGLSLEIYKDKRLTKKVDKYKPLLGEVIRNINLSMNVPTINIKDAFIDYQEREVNSEAPLHVYFKNFDLDISNFSTDSSSLAKNDTLSIAAHGIFMQDGKLDFTIDFPILDSISPFIFEGQITDMKLEELNPILKNSAFIKFAEGDLNFAKFYMRGTNDDIKGELDLDYQGLTNLQVVRKKDEMEERKEKGKKKKSEKALLSFLATNIAPKDYNSSLKRYHTGEISYERNQYKSMFNLIINGLKSGVLDSFLKNHEGLKTKLKSKKKKEKDSN